MTRCLKLAYDMHELAICQSLMNQIEDIALKQNAQFVTSIVLAIGPLSGVEAHALKQAYPIASAGTIAAQAELVIKQLPIRVKCNQCGSESDALPNKLTCKQCGDWRTTLISGDELLLMSVELERNTESQNTSMDKGSAVEESLH